MTDPYEQKPAGKTLLNEVIELGEFSAAFARVYRVPRHADGTRENDVEHSYSLALVARFLANKIYPDLDSDLVVSFCIIHDAPERYVSDTPTLGISEEDRARKEAAEAIATQRLVIELPDSYADLLERYEKQEESEARFVRLVDKLMPLLINIIGDGKRSIDYYGIKSYEQLQQLEFEARQRLSNQFPEFPEVLKLHEGLTERRRELVFDIDGTLRISRLNRIRGSLSDLLMRAAKVVSPKS